jgi:serine/threonine protein kinase/tetratricopeptide (TPR) repeat protein
MNEPARQIMTLLGEAVEYASPEERAAFLDRACAGDPVLRARIEALLRAYEAAGNFLQGSQPPAEFAATVDELPIAESPGSFVGPYKLLEKIGEGGFGVVFMAEQQEPIRRKVALKVLKPGMDTRQVIARFEAERQALALMDHPNIAKVLDAGATTSGRPYFVMELVKGVPVTKFCDDNRLALTERLDLFVSVCQAIQHAHQKGVIHRDIKPSNVLVTLHDGTPVVKVIDFGIAKATKQQLTAKTLFTGFAQMVGTPLYMSPEQAGLSGLDVDTRSDTYSLGVLLYELLTGTTPFDSARLQKVGYDEMRRIIREEEPPRPSTRISTLGQAATTVSTQRKSDPRRLSQLFRGELDWIVMKALEKDRNRRYESASAFAADVQRYLHDEPVQACPPSAWYRLRKFARRNKGPALAATLVVLALVGGVIGTTVGMVRALAAEQRAVTEGNQKEVALGRVKEEIDEKEEALGRVKKERDQKEDARRDAVKERDQKEEARRQARLALNTLTNDVVQDLLGRQVQLTDQHRDFLKKVLAQHEAFAAARGDDLEGRQSRAEGYSHVGRIRHRLGQSEDAETAYGAALELWKQLANDHQDRPEFLNNVATCYHNLGMVRHDMGRPDEAEAAFHKALDIGNELVAAHPGRAEFRYQLARDYHNLGIMLFDCHRSLEAESAHEAALLHWARLTTDFPDNADYAHALSQCHNERGLVLKDTRRPDKAEQAFSESLKLKKQLIEKFPENAQYRQDLATTFNNLGVLLRAEKRYTEAESANDEALKIRKELAAEFPSRPDLLLALAQSHNTCGNLFRFTNRPKLAEESYSDALAAYGRLTTDYPKRPDYRRDMALCYCNVGSFMREINRPEDAKAAFDKARVMWDKLATDFRGRLDFRKELARIYTDLGNLHRDEERPKESEAAYRTALTFQKELVDAAPKRPELREELAQIYVRIGRVHLTRSPDDTESAWREALTIQEKLADDFPKVPTYQNDLAATLVNLATLRNERRDFDTALKLLEKARPHHQAALKANENDPTYRQFYRNNISCRVASCIGLADHAELAGAAEELARFGYNLPGDLFDAADHLCSCATLAGKDSRLIALKRKELADRYADQALAVLQQLVERGYNDAARFPNQPRYRRDLGQCYLALANTLNEINRPRDAELLYRDVQVFQRQLTADFPRVPDYQNDLAGTLVNLAGLHKQRGEFEAAVALLEEARPYHQTALNINPRPHYRNFYRNNLWVMADCRLGQADHARLAAAADELARFAYDPPNDAYNAACYLSRCATLADKDAGLDADRRAELAQGYAGRALELLRLAVARGYKNAARMKQDPDLEPLRTRDEFKALVAELEEKRKQ